MIKNPALTKEIKQEKGSKKDIKFTFSLNEEQKIAKGIILANKITVIRGKAGSGKTALASQIALDQLFKDQKEKIIICRPTITSGEEVGFLPGDIKEKLGPFTAPVYDNMYRLYDKSKVDKIIEEGRIEVIPFAFMRGRNFSNAFVIIDEAQNITFTQMKLVLSRMCLGSKYVVCGDTTQIDLKDKKQSGFDFLYKHFKDVKGFASVCLKENHRDPIVDDILTIFEEFEG